MKSFVGWGCGFVVAVLLGLAVYFVVGVLVLGMQLPFMNIQRVVTQHSIEYVQAHQTQLMSEYADYQSGDAAHKAAAKTEICSQYQLLDAPERPSQIVFFVTQNCG